MNKEYDPFSTKPISCYMEDFVEIGEGVRTSWVLKDFLPFGGKMLIWGDTNAGKSPLMATLAHSIITGKPFLRKFPVCQGNVAYMMMPDMAFDEWRDRWKKWKENDMMPPKGTFLTHYHFTNARIDEVADRIRKLGSKALPEEMEWISDLRKHNASVVFIDVLSETHQLDSSDGLTPTKIYDSWRLICGNRPGLVFVHHDKKPFHATTTGKKLDDAKHSFSGHMGWLNLVSGGIHIDNPGDLKYFISLEKARNTPKTTFPISLNLDTMLFDIGDDKWAKAWTMLERGEEPDMVMKKIADRNFDIGKASKVINQIRDVMEAQVEMRRLEMKAV